MQTIRPIENIIAAEQKIAEAREGGYDVAVVSLTRDYHDRCYAFAASLDAREIATAYFEAEQRGADDFCAILKAARKAFYALSSLHEATFNEAFDNCENRTQENAVCHRYTYMKERAENRITLFDYYFAR